MLKKIPLSTAVVLILLAVLVTFQITYLAVNNKFEHKLNELEASAEHKLYSKLNSVDDLFRKLYIGEIDEAQLADSIIQGYIKGTGDKYAEYMNSEEFERFLNDLGGELEGIGIVVIYNTEYTVLEIASVYPDSPAYEAGVEPGDFIIEVDGVDVATLGFYSAVAAMQGKADTYANFTVARGENYSERIEMSVKRGFIINQSVTHHMYNDGTNSIGIIRILMFAENTPGQFKAAVEGLLEQGVQKFVFDVRYNSGGDLNSIVEILDYLLPAGPVIRITDIEGNVETKNSVDGELNAKMAVLINGSTASAAELFAAALRDYQKAELIGEQSFGKGSMQTIMRLEDNSALRVTYRMYSPPYSDNYDGIGITPDHEVYMDPAVADINIYKLTDEQDTQLQAAIKILNN